MTRQSGVSHLVNAAALVAALWPAVTGRADEVIWQQVYDLQGSWGPSQITPSNPGQLNQELADDFDLTGTVSRVDVTGINTFFGQGSAPFYGLHVRFYAFGQDGKPGALLAQYYLPRNDPRLWMDFPDYPMSFHATLEPPFQASGRCFLAVQTRMDVRDGSRWEWDGANRPISPGEVRRPRPRGESFYLRDLNAPDPSWHHVGTSPSDLALTLWGTAEPQPPTIYALATDTAVRSGRILIHGVRFRDQQGNGYVTIDGRQAPVTRWSDWQIVAYVPEITALGPVTLEVVNDVGASNQLSLTVTARPPPQGHLKWRFQADSFYIQHRPAVGSDGTVYSIDATGVLYALRPDGGLKWLVRAGGVGGVTHGPVAIGPDDTTYVATQPNTITAVNPDGTIRWVFNDPSYQAVEVGPTVGPDGNIYAVNDLTGLGAFALSPEGELLWNIPGFAFYGGIGRELVFAPQGQFYFQDAPQIGPRFLYAVGLDGQMRWQYNVHLGGIGPAVGPDGTAYVSWYSASTSRHVEAIDPNGSLSWWLFHDHLGNMSGPDVGPDGTIYIVGNFNYLLAIRPNGTVQWEYFENVLMGSPNVSPRNDLVLMGGSDYVPPEYPAFIKAVSTSAQPLWRVDLPFENDAYVRVDSPARFTPDGRTAYVGMSGNAYAEDVYCYLYAVQSDLAGDIDGDGDVDMTDRDLFVAVLTGLNTNPQHVARSDVNGDGAANAEDTAPFVVALLNG